MATAFGIVKEIRRNKEHSLARIEDDSLYTGGGGQPCDRVTIRQEKRYYKVTETCVENGIIYWVVPGDKLHVGEIEIERDDLYRWEISQQHSAQHIFSGLAMLTFGYPSDGFSIFEGESKIELLGADLDSAKYAWLEEETNQVIAQGKPIQVYEAKYGEELRKASNPLHTRIVEIKGVDKCCCGGTHVVNTLNGDIQERVSILDHVPLSLDSLKYLSLAIKQKGISSVLINQEGYFVLSGEESENLFEELKKQGAKGGGKGVITGKVSSL